MFSFFKALFSSNDLGADSIVVSGLLAMAGLVAFSGYSTYVHPEQFNPVNYGTAVAAILAGIGGARWMRDGQGANVHQP